ncbi:DUF5977 domain-containing protein [Niabella sp. 22666]|uniref:DUF5977 domain-containing protein n=1 Tax=Niabella sp. 22666 TaxID=3453954 RepID=UPI003F8738C6
MKWLTISLKSRMLICIALGLSVKCLSQPNMPSTNTISSGIASMNQKAQISNDPFNGKVNIGIPIFSYQFEGNNYPISLFYTGGNGIKVEERPSLVGLGWGLQVGGGYVHRTVRGRPDEVKDFKTTITSLYNFNGIHQSTKLATELNGSDFSYRSNAGLLNNNNWTSTSYISSLRGSYFNKSGYYSDPNSDVVTYNSSPVKDLVPDEYSFEAAGISGKFYLNQYNKWVVTSSDNKHYNIEVNVGELNIIDSTVNTPLGGQTRYRYNAPRIIKSFKIHSPDGYTYVFGNEDANATFKEQFFEYSRTSTVRNWVADPTAPPYNTQKSGFDGATYVDIAPHTWLLTKIINKKTGSVIRYNYAYVGSEVYKSNQAWGHIWNNSSTQSTVIYNNAMIVQYNNLYSTESEPQESIKWLSANSEILTRKWHLQSINFPNGVNVVFHQSLSNQLGANVAGGANNTYDFYPDIYLKYSSGIGLNKVQQLDSISIFNNDDIYKTFIFNYVQSPSGRLQLSSLKERGVSGISNLESFAYDNSFSLPEYGSRKVDHWGYYNSKDFFTEIVAPYTMPKMQLYSSYRDPDTIFGQSEILKEVVYRTGGKIRFIYEPQWFSKERTLNGFTQLGSNRFAGGVRIKAIENFASGDILSGVTQFNYVVPGTQVSTGVLSKPKPDYLYPTPAGTLDLYSFYAGGYNPMNYGGSHVTYSLVNVSEANNGSTEFEYTNYDNGFDDIGPVATNFDQWDLNESATAYSNTSFKRGKPITIKTLNSDNIPIETKFLSYDHNRSNQDKDVVRSLYFKDIWPNKYAAVLDTIYQDRLREETVQHFSQGNALIEQTKYSYDSLGNIEESIGPDGKGGIIKTKYKYAYDQEYTGTGSDEISQGIAFQKSLGIKNCLVEKLVIAQNNDGSNARIIDGAIYTYHINKAFPYKEYKLNSNVPISESGFSKSSINGGLFQKDSRYNISPEVTFTVYDASGNLLESVDKTGIKTSYLLGYNKQYVVAKIIGTDHLTVSSLVNSLVLNNPPSDAALRLELNKIRAGLNSSQAQIYTYTHAPLVGMTSETGPTNKTTYYQYDDFGRLSTIRDHELKLVKQICYNYQGQQVDCNLLPVYRNKLIKETISKKDCAPGGFGTNVDYVVPAGTYASEISQEDADQKALNDIAANGQNYANQHGECKAVVTVKNNGTSGTIMGSIEIINQNNEIVGTAGVGGPGNTTVLHISTGYYTVRFISPGADALFDINGTQVLAQTNMSSYEVILGNFNIDGAINVYAYPQGSYFGNAYMTQNFTRSCTGGLSGTSVAYTVPANKYYSAVSQADANQKALNEITANGQNYANSTGSCVQNVNITLYSSGSLGGSIEFIPSGASSGYYSSLPSSGTHPMQVPAGTYYVKVSTGSSRSYSLNYYINGPFFQVSIPSGQYSATSSTTVTLSSGTNYIVQPPTN